MPTLPRPQSRRALWLLLLAVAGAAATLPADQRPTARVVVGCNWPPRARVALAAIDHAGWNSLLRTYVTADGLVDYAAWQKSPHDLQALRDYLVELSRADLLSPAPRAAQIAFWMNAYNALTIFGILREYPARSLAHHARAGAGYNLWRDLVLRVGRGEYSLGQIEHDRLRPLHDARIHFGIVCGSRGCPRLRNEAYTPGALNGQLNADGRRFLAQPANFNHDRQAGTLRFSPILQWYANDFGKTDAERLQAIAPFLPVDAVEQLRRTPEMPIHFGEYDWQLNDAATNAEPPPSSPEDLGAPPD